MAINKGHALANAVAKLHADQKKKHGGLRKALKDAGQKGADLSSEELYYDAHSEKESKFADADGGPTKDARTSGKVKEKAGSNFKKYDPARRPLQPKTNVLGQTDVASRLEQKQTASDVSREAYKKRK